MHSVYKYSMFLCGKLFSIQQTKRQNVYLFINDWILLNQAIESNTIQ